MPENDTKTEELTQTPARFEVGGKVYTPEEAAAAIAAAEKAAAEAAELRAKVADAEAFKDAAGRFINSNDWNSFVTIAKDRGWSDSQIEAFAKVRNARIEAARKASEGYNDGDEFGGEEDDDDDIDEDVKGGKRGKMNSIIKAIQQLRAEVNKRPGFQNFDPATQKFLERLAAATTSNLDRALESDVRSAFDNDPIFRKMIGSEGVSKRVLKLRSIALSEAKRLAKASGGDYSADVLSEAVAKARSEAADYGVLPDANSNSPPSGVPSLGGIPSLTGLEQHRPTGKKPGKLTVNSPTFADDLGDTLAHIIETGKVPETLYR